MDRTNTIGVVWLGLTLGCAQCHDHKYDPITQKDYYRLFAYFDNLEPRDVEAPLPGELGPYLQSRPQYIRLRQELLDQYGIPRLQAEWERNLIDAADNPSYRPAFDTALAGLKVNVDLGERILRKNVADRTEDEQHRLTQFFVENYFSMVGKERYEQLRFGEFLQKLKKLDASTHSLTRAQTIKEGETPRQTHVHVRGEFDRRGIEVEGGTPAFLPPSLEEAQTSRLALAKWLVSPENPLTARVAANRMWQEFFGRGIVLTAEDFGTQGEKPTHPELLDWLAREFIARGWSMKQMHRLVVTSATYRQSSNRRPKLEGRDPDNRLLARQNRLRLPAELVRDAALAVSGLLNPVIGGRSVALSPPATREDKKLEIIALGEMGAPERFRRGVYTHFQRKTPHPQLMNFDAPNSFEAVCRRERSNTPLQALNLLNDTTFFEAAQAIAVQVLREVPGTVDDRLDYSFQSCLGRPPSAREREVLTSYYFREKALLEEDPEAASLAFPFQLPDIDVQEGASWVGLARVLLNLDQFIVRE